MMNDFNCKQCGHCCLNLYDAFSTTVSEEDFFLWETEGRHDILEWVKIIDPRDGEGVYDIWINPETGEDVERCPWLRKLPNQDKYFCLIHDVKPSHCLEYPHSRKHAEDTGCVGFEGEVNKK